MKNLSIFVLVMVALLVFGASAHAVMREFSGFTTDNFSLEVPDGWTVLQADKSKFDGGFPGGMIYMESQDGESSITFLCINSEGLYAPTFAAAIAGTLGGSNPVENGVGDFEIRYVKNGVESFARTRQWGNLGVVMESDSNFTNVLSILETLN